jgi:hypothetical protein
MVKAINSAGEESDYSSIASGTTSKIDAPALSVDTVSETSAGVSWTSVTHATSYTLQWGTTTSYAGGSYTAASTATSYTIPGLTAGTLYYVRICTNQSGKTSSDWDTASFTTTADDTPAVPTGLAISAITTSSMNLSWNAASNAVSYTISWGADTSMSSVVTGVTSTSHPFTGLSESTTYYFKVRSVNSAGEVSDYSSTVSGTTLTDTTTDGAETPVIDSVNPSAAAIGTIITISGHDFGDSQGASQVWFGDGITTVTVDTVQSWSDGTIMVAVPEGLESKTYALQVYRRASTLGVGALSNAVQFEVIAMSTTLKAYPNPFNPLSETLKMQVSVTDTTSVGVYIYDVTGRLVYQTTQTLTTGTTNIEWDGKIFTGQTAGDGAYLIRIVNEGNKTLISKGKIIVIKHQ